VFIGSVMTARIRTRLGCGGSWIGSWALSGPAAVGLGLAGSVNPEAA